MISFMFGVLGSVLFWVVYGVISFVVSSILWKKMCPDEYRWTKDGESGWLITWVFFFLLWIPIGIVLVIYIIFKNIISPMLFKGVMGAIRLIPEFEIRKKDTTD